MEPKLIHGSDNKLINLRTNLILFIMFFCISAGLGYAVLNRYAAEQLPQLSDVLYYQDIVKHGIQSISSDLRTTRIILPMVAHGLYLLLPEQIGSWSVIAFSMLFTNSVFCSLSALLTFNLALLITKSSSLGLIASCLYLLNFTVTNIHLTGLIDSGYSFSIVLLVYLIMTGRFSLLPLLGVMGCLIKEIFFPISISFLIGWIVADFYKTKKLNKRLLINSILFLFLSATTLLALQYGFNGFIRKPWEYIPGQMIHPQYQGIDLLKQVAKFMYIFVWLLPLGLWSLYCLPFRLRLALAFASALSLLLLFWVGASGLGIGRNIFNVVGPSLCISAAYTLLKLLRAHDTEKD